MGVWIEIPKAKNLFERIEVTPLVGVWIEISVMSAMYSGDSVTPLVGVWIEILHGKVTRLFSMSLPLWECGLK